MEIPDFKTFEEFFGWIKGLEFETIKENELKILSYHNLKYHNFFNLNGWTFDNFKRFWAYVNEAEYYEDAKEFEKIPDVDTIENDGFEPEKLEEEVKLDKVKQQKEEIPTNKNIVLPCFEGWNALKKYLDKGIKLIGVYESGATIATGEAYEQAFTCDPKVIEGLWLGKDERTKGVQIRRFYFRPKEAGLLCLDIDKKNEKDGVFELYKFLKNELGSFGNLLPKILRDIPRNFPFYIESPNGFHLYFKYTYNGNVIKNTLAEGVEIKASSLTLTTGGSFKEEKPYIIYGKFDDIPTLPPLLKVAILQKPVTIKHKRYNRYNRNITLRNKPTWSQIKSWCRTDFPNFFRDVGVGYRDNQAYCMARKAISRGYTYYEALDALLEDEDVNDLGAKALEEKVKSAYKEVYK